MARVSRALLAVFASAVAVGYLAGMSFRPSPAATALKRAPVRRYVAVEPLPPQSTILHTANGRFFGATAGADVEAAGERRFHIQVRVSESPTETEAVARELRRRGYAVHVGPGAPFGIRVGGDLDRPTAERLIKRLSAGGFGATLAAR